MITAIGIHAIYLKYPQFMNYRIMIPPQVQSLIDELSKDARYVGGCPSCGKSFNLGSAGMFYSNHLTRAGRDAQKGLKETLADLAEQIKKKRLAINEGAPKKSIEVNIGKVVEKIAPMLPGFPFHINDCRFMAEPIDYMVFNGISLRERIDDIIFMDIKTGKARLSPHQRQIKKVVEEGKIEMELY